MPIDLESIAFDHYQRYAAATALVRALEMPRSTVLEVGANRQRLLADFLTDSTLIFSDLFAQLGSDDFVQADASALPFENAKFDVVVSLDVLEHMPPRLRATAAVEMARVAARMLVISCPTDNPWVHAAEQAANGVWRDYFDKDYPWLEEHKEFGLVEGDAIEHALLDAGCKVLRFGQGDTALWSGLMSAHFVKEVIEEMRPIVASADHLYNHSVFAGDRSDEAYREYFIAVRTDEDLERIRASSLLTAQPDSAAVKLLSNLGASLRPIADRIRTAESQWHLAANRVVETEAGLLEARTEWGRTAELLRTSEAKQLYAVEQWKTNAALVLATNEQLEKSAALVRAANEELEQIRAQLAESERSLLESERSLLEREGLLLEREGLLLETVNARDRLLLRVNGLERRQRWALRGGVIVALIAVIAVISLRLV
ncbi:MAG: methyltransferase domain-containing protein [Rhodanobacter sp.]